MTIKETRNVEKIKLVGEKFVYSQERIMELEPSDLLKVATNNRVTISNAEAQIVAAKADLKRANSFLLLNKKAIDEASRLANQQFCEKCGMNFGLPQNKGMKSNKTKAPYSVLCKNCATKEGL